MRLFSSLLWLIALKVAAADSIYDLRMLMTDPRFVNLVSPCTTGGSARTLAGEWIRTAFHDAVSYNAATGTGGIDGSIGFETSRVENTGTFATLTLIQYRNLQTTSMSLADLIALGAITAVGSCGGPVIPFLAGRVDAGGAAEEGHVPLPEEPLETHQQKFARMGFSNQEMITAVACGHTVGGVHAANNPTITSATNAAFDLTRNTYDNAVAVEYMNNVLTNPLGQPINSSVPERSSDTRIFSSDGNSTLARYASSQSEFFKDCTTIFGRMLNDAVPSNTQLTAPLAPFPVAISLRLVMKSGKLITQNGSMRLYDLVGQYSSFDVTYTNRDGEQGTDPNLFIPGNPSNLSNGKPVTVRHVRTLATGVDLATGVSSVSVRLTMNDGSVYSSAEGAEVHKVDDSIWVDIGPAYSCAYGTSGVNITIAVLGPYNPADKVEVEYELASDATRRTYGSPLQATYRRASDDSPYVYYGLFVPDRAAINFGNFAAKITRADGTISRDDHAGLWHWYSNLSACLAGAEIPTPAPQPTTGLSSASRRRSFCGQGKVMCGDKCVNTLTSLESCGGCPGEGGVDCTTLGDVVWCIKGKCVVG